jgi:predicted  nucleic acid-binding Zn-ribbon protein
MQSLKSLAEDTIRQSKTGKINARTSYLRADPAINVFIVLNDQRAELLRLRLETLAHVWVRGQNGILELVALDNEFDQLQLSIAALEGKITTNMKIASDLDKAFHDLQIEPPHSALDERIREIHAQIECKKQELADKLAPYRATHADLDKIPEVIQARAETAGQVTALESEARVIETKLARIHEILRGVVR